MVIILFILLILVVVFIFFVAFVHFHAERADGEEMSYEGYSQFICRNGHQYVSDVYDGDRECDYCQTPPVWCYSVDQTNGCECDYIKEQNIKVDRPDGLCNAHAIKLEVLVAAEFETCNHCNHSKLIKEATYKVPDNVGRRIK